MFEEYNSDILKSIGQKPNVPIEIEARWGNIPQALFVHLQSVLNKITPPEYREQLDKTDKTGVRESELSDGTKRYIRKNKVSEYDEKGYQVQLSIAFEETVNVTQLESVVERQKKRWSYTLFNGGCRADLTQVDQTLFQLSESKQAFEVELELLDLQRLNTFYAWITTIHSWLYATENIYTVVQRQVLEKKFNLLTGSTGDQVDTGMITKARDLGWRDLTAGGIVNNPRYSYVIQHKVDGQMRIVMTSESGLWAFNPPFFFNQLLTKVPPELQDIILYTENVPSERRRAGAPTTPYWFIINDVIVLRNHLPSNTLTDRKKGLESFLDGLNGLMPNKIRFATISTSSLSLDTFYDTMLDAYHSLEFAPYETDGFIIKPDKAPYQTHSDKKDLRERSLSLLPDVCKLKPVELSSLDLELRWQIGGQPDLYTWHLDQVPFDIKFESTKMIEGRVMSMVWDNKKDALVAVRPSNNKITMQKIKADIKLKSIRGLKEVYFDLLYKEGKLWVEAPKEVVFRGTEKFPFTPDRIDVTDMIINQPSGLIVEFVYRGNKLVPYRLRPEKDKPNRLVHIQEAWDLINDPITQKTFELGSPDLFNHHIERFDTMVRGSFDTINLQPGKSITFATWDPIALDVYPPSNLILKPPPQSRSMEIWNSLLTQGVIPKDIHTLDTDILLKPEYRKVASYWFQGTLDIPENYKVSEVPKVDEVYLTMIPVDISRLRSHTAALYDDYWLPVRCKWYDGALVRIGTIGDGSCFFHAYLKGFYPKYQLTKFSDERILLVRLFRNELASTLSLKFKGTDINVYQAINEGELANMGKIEGMEDFYTLAGLTKLLYSSNDVGDEVYSYVADLIGVDVVVVRGTTEDLHRHSSTFIACNDRPFVMIMGQGAHYELIGELVEGKIKTLFRSSDRLYQQLKNYDQDMGIPQGCSK